MKKVKIRQLIREFLKEEFEQNQDGALIDYLRGALEDELELEDDLDVPLSEYFDLEEMARPTKQYVLVPGKTPDDIERFLNLANKFITSRSSKKLDPQYAEEGNFFTQADIAAILNIITNQKSFTAQDFVNGVQRFDRVQQPNAILKVLSDEYIEDPKTFDVIMGKGYITDIYNVKQQEPED